MTSDFLRAAQANVIVHLRRGMRLIVLGAFLTGAIVVAAVVGLPLPWWLTATAAASLAVHGHSLMTLRQVLAQTDAGAVHGWMKFSAYTMGVAGAAGLLWALWQMSMHLGAT